MLSLNFFGDFSDRAQESTDLRARGLKKSRNLK